MDPSLALYVQVSFRSSEDEFCETSCCEFSRTTVASESLPESLAEFSSLELLAWFCDGLWLCVLNDCCFVARIFDKGFPAELRGAASPGECFLRAISYERKKDPVRN